jgi:predicted nucleic acid-binding protein
VIVLVDTSVWSLALRRIHGNLSPHQQQLRHTLEELIAEGRVRLLGIVRQELLSGIRHEEQFEKLRKALRAFDDIELTQEDHEEAASIANNCRSAGITGSAIDFLICAVATRRKWAVFTLDEDFQQYKRQIPLTLFRPKAQLY